MLIHAQFFHNLGRKISHEIFVKIENTVYLSNQLTFAIFDLVMMFPIKNWTFEQILVFSISEMYLPCPIPTVNLEYRDFPGFTRKNSNTGGPRIARKFVQKFLRAIRNRTI